MDNQRPEFDHLISTIADYALTENPTFSANAYKTAYYCLLDSIACALMALKFPACNKLLGPYLPNTSTKNGCPIPGTDFKLDPIQAAFNIGTLIRWLDFNDTWLAEEWGHPSDNLGAILAIGDYMSRHNNTTVTVQDVLNAMIIAYEIQGVIALKNSFNKVGLDHVLLVKIASTAATARLLKLDREQTLNAISHAWLDGQALRTYRHAPNTGSRKSWAAGDATARAVRLAWFAERNEMGYPSAISATTWGFQDSLFRGNEIKVTQDFDDYVMQNILWKISFPAEFHAQTAVECAITLHPQVVSKLEEIERIEIKTQEAAMRIINKNGALHNPADRDHCLQYMIAVGLLEGDLSAEHYEDSYTESTTIDKLRNIMHVTENRQFTLDYLDPTKRSIANSVQVFYQDGSSTEEITVEYPIGHRRRRREGVPVLINKFKQAIDDHYGNDQAKTIQAKLLDYEGLLNLEVTEIMDILAKKTE